MTPTPLQLPTVGRIVHYIRPHDSSMTPCAALIVFVSTVEVASRADREDGMPLVNLTYFEPDGHRHMQLAVSYSEAYKQNCWSWPPRV
jgi:hypothetical protein